MTSEILYPRKEIKAFFGPTKILTIIATCPKPLLPMDVMVKKSPLDIYPPIYLLVAKRSIVDPAGSKALGGEIPFPWINHPTIQVVGSFPVPKQPDYVRVVHAEGEDHVKVVPIYETAEADMAIVGFSPPANSAEGTGFSDSSFEDAFNKAVEAAFAKLGPDRNVDGITEVTVVRQGAIYGGIVGSFSNRFVTVRAQRQLSQFNQEIAAIAATPTVLFPLKLHLEAHPAMLYVNEMPGTPDKPQPHNVELLLIVTNDRRSDYHGEWPNTGIVKMWVRDKHGADDKEIWHFPELVLQMVTFVSIPAGQSRTYRAIWTIPDARALLGHDVTIHAKFEPTSQETSVPFPIGVAQLAAAIKADIEILVDKEQQPNFISALSQVESAKSEADLQAALQTAAGVVSNAKNRGDCEARCKAAYDECVKHCKNTSCITQCFGRYILCVKKCRSKS